MTQPIAGIAILAVHERMWERQDTSAVAFGTTSFVEGIGAAINNPEWARWVYERLVAEGMPTDPDIDWPVLINREFIELTEAQGTTP